MAVNINRILTIISKQIFDDLHQLNVPIHLSRYRQLCVAIYLFSLDPSQLLCDELYPTIAKALGYTDWRAVEFAIRKVVLSAWEHRDSETWNQYFPGIVKAPTNKRFIAKLAHRITPLPAREGVTQIVGRRYVAFLSQAVFLFKISDDCRVVIAF